jgi:CRP/FNR family transcriptional regulator, cyclic AMP receptor protein
MPDPFNLTLTDWIGVLAALGGALALSSRTMIPLRIAAIASNGFFAVYAAHYSMWISVTLYAVILVTNAYRLTDMLRMIRRSSDEVPGAFPVNRLKPHMDARRFAAGSTICRKGDPADCAYYIVSGTVRVDGPGIELGEGDMLGEMGLFSNERTRNATAIAVGEVNMLTISYEKLQELCLQNPRFGFELLRLMVERLQAGNSGGTAARGRASGNRGHDIS